jgi:hypothetical protein
MASRLFSRNFPMGEVIGAVPSNQHPTRSREASKKIENRHCVEIPKNP